MKFDELIETYRDKSLTEAEKGTRKVWLACKYMRIIESWGSGVLRVQKALKEYGLPALEIRDNGVDVVFSIRRRVKASDLTPNTNVPANVPVNVPVNVPANVTVKSAGKMLAIIRANPGINRVALGKALGVSVKTISRYAKALKGYVKFEGPSKTGGYSVIESEC